MRARCRAETPRLARRVMAALTGVSFLALWGFAIWRTPYDFDELMQIHSTWLVATGHVPYRDFLEIHPPGFWYLLRPLLAVFGDRPEALLGIRGVAFLGHLAFLGAVVANARLGRPSQGNLLWILALCSLFALSGDTPLYLAEGRMDSWGYGVLLWATYLLRRLTNRMLARVILAISAVASVFLVPKFSLLVGLLCPFELLSRERYSPRRLALGMLAYLAGAVIGIIAILAFFRSIGIDARQYVELVGLYNWRWNEWARGSVFLEVIVAEGVLLTIILCGVVHRIWRHVSAKERMSWYDGSILAFLLAQAFFVSWPYKQYTAPWLILGLHYGCELPGLAARLTPRTRHAAATILSVAVLFTGARFYTSLRHAYSPRRQEALIRQLASLVDPGAYVAAPVLAHPIFRRDTFHAWFTTSDYWGRRDLTETLLSMSRDTAELATRQSYYRELSERSPSLIVTGGRGNLSEFLPGQATQLQFYLERESESYERRDVQGLVVYVRKSTD